MFQRLSHWGVLAVTSCFYGAFQISTSIGVLLGNVVDSVFDAAADVDASPFGIISGASFPPAEPESA
jgi:hypothetical protein